MRSRWYVADIVVAISIEGVRETIVNINSYLLRATTPTDARTKAIARGRLERMPPSRNAGGQLVTYRFLGIHQLRAIDDKLEHGAEVRWEERRVRSLADAKALVRRKRELGAFRR